MGASGAQTTSRGASSIDAISAESSGRRARESNTTLAGFRAGSRSDPSPASASSPMRAVSSGSSAKAVPIPTAIASHSERQRCTSSRLGAPEIQRESPPGAATRPSRVIAAL